MSDPLPFLEACQRANDFYLKHRQDFTPIHQQRTVSELRLIERNRKKAFFDDLHAQRMWDRRHQ